MSPAAASSPIRAAWLAFAVGLALSVVTFREGPMLGFDPYHYCEFAKNYTHTWPIAFGNDWPCGLPLLAGLLGRLGVPAYAALCVISVSALGLIVFLNRRLIAPLPAGALALIALVATPAISAQIFGALSELPFAACWLGLGVSLAHWPERRALWLAAAFAVAGICMRYVGVLALGVLWLWFLVELRQLRASRMAGSAFAANLTASAAIGLLLLWNILVTGHASGADRNGTGLAGLAHLPLQATQFGWSLPSAGMLGGVRDAFGPTSLLGEIIGGSLALGVFVLCIWSWLKPAQSWSRAMALICVAYSGGMILLRSIGSFDELYNARTAVPLVFPLGALLVGQLAPRFSRLVLCGSIALLALGLVMSLRGLSRQFSGDVRPAVAVLRPLLRPDDVVQINTRGWTLSAYLRQHTQQAWVEYWDDKYATRFLVVVGQPLDRHGSPDHVAPEWRQLAERLVATGQHRWLLHTDSVYVLERIAPTP